MNRETVQIQSHLVESSESEWLFGRTREQKCERWQKEFELRTQEMQTATSSMKENGNGPLSTVSTVMKLRSVTRIYQRAATAECEWVASREADTTALQSTVDENLAENPCFDQARVLLTHEWENAAEQTRAMTIATRMLMERTCESEDFDRMVAELDAGSAANEEEVDPQEELEVLAEESDEVADEFVAAVMSEEGASLLQTDAAAQFIRTLQELVALVAFLLIWAILCLVFVPVILMVIGAVLCTLNWVLQRFLRHNANLGNCMNWWAHQTQTIFAPGNELMTAGACLIAGWLGALPHAHVYFPNLPRIYVRR